MKASNEKRFERNYALHLQHLKLKGLQPKTVEAYSRAIRRIGAYFDGRIDALSEQQLTDYFTDPVALPKIGADRLTIAPQPSAFGTAAETAGLKPTSGTPRPPVGLPAESIQKRYLQGRRRRDVTRIGLVQQTLQIVASHDLTLFVRRERPRTRRDC